MSHKVLVVVDVQNDFVKGGALGYGYPKKSNTDLLCAYVNKTLQRGDYVIATRDTHHDNYLETLEGKKLPIQHCIHQTHGWELVQGLANLEVANSGIVIFDKPTFGTPLVGEYIRKLIDEDSIDEIQLVGYCLSICVLAAAVLLRSRFPNMKISVIKELCGDIDKESFDAALKVLSNQQIEIQ